jgi:hypothetical protein
MNKKIARRNLLWAGALIGMALGMTIAFLAYIEIFRSLPR